VPSAEEVTAFIVQCLKSRAPKATPADLDAAESLVARGLVDSFSFLELVGDVEAKFGVKIDLGAHDFEEISTIQGLRKAVLAPG
jgi:acyl carrier protein